MENENLILLTSASQTRMILEEKFAENDITPKYVQECALVDMIFDLVDTNFGISLLGETLYDYSYEGTNSIKIPIDNKVSRDIVMLISAKATTSSKYLKSFTKHIIENLKKIHEINCEQNFKYYRRCILSIGDI